MRKDARDRKIEKDLRAKLGISKDEGLLSFSFAFNGKKYLETHKLSAGDIRLLRRDAEEFGEESVNSTVMRLTFGTGKALAEAAIARAMMEYIVEHHKPAVVEQQKTVFDIPGEQQ